MTEFTDQFEQALVKNAPGFELELSARVCAGLVSYYNILRAWNPRLHLVAPCSAEEFAMRHVLESILAIKYIRANAEVVDIGSGGGLPIIPCLISRPDISATLIESSPKKGIFLREALRNADVNERASVLTNRFEDLPVREANVVTCRALEQFTAAFPAICDWSPANSTIILFGGPALQPQIEKGARRFISERIPKSDHRFVFVIEKSDLRS